MFHNKNKDRMKLKHFFIIVTLIPAMLDAAQRIKNSDSPIKINDTTQMTVVALIDHKKLGKTPIVTTANNKAPFKKTGSVAKMKPDEFNLIANGYAFYYPHYRQTSGAIIINPHVKFDKKTMERTAQKIEDEQRVKRDARIMRKLAKKDERFIKLEA